MKSITSLTLSLTSIAFASDIKVATFDGASATSHKWVQKNDPVMGGKSTGTWTIANNTAGKKKRKIKRRSEGMKAQWLLHPCYISLTYVVFFLSLSLLSPLFSLSLSLSALSLSLSLSLTHCSLSLTVTLHYIKSVRR